MYFILVGKRNEPAVLFVIRSMFKVLIAQVDYQRHAPCLKDETYLIPERVTN
jgi:hypothetical protein